jgi:hypothetical protein
MGSSPKCPKCNQEHDLSLSKCPEASLVVTRVLPPTGPKPSPSNPPPVGAMEAPPALLKVEAEAKKAEDKMEEKAVTPIPSPAPIKMPTSPKTEALKGEAPKGLEPSLLALAAAIEAPKPETKNPMKETQISGDAVILYPTTPKEDATNLYQKARLAIKGKEKIVGFLAAWVLLLIGIWAFWGGSKPTQAANSAAKESPLFSAAPLVTPNTQGIATSEPATAATDTIPLTVEASPASAVVVVWVDGAVFHSGTAPLTISVPKDSSVEVTLAAAGYEPEQKTFKAKEEKTIKEDLSKLGAKSSGSSGSSSAGKSSGKSGGGWGGWGGK